MRRCGLRDDQWERIRDVLSVPEGHVGVTAGDNRLFVEAVLYRYRAMEWPPSNWTLALSGGLLAGELTRGPDKKRRIGEGNGSSPHARGTRGCHPSAPHARRLIPACAGNTRKWRRC
jgi:hypothetical protein